MFIESDFDEKKLKQMQSIYDATKMPHLSMPNS